MRFRPKRWPAPKSRRTREDDAMAASGWSSQEFTYEILRGLWSARGRKPWWAKLAFERGWITLVGYLQVPNEPGPTLAELLYTEDRFFKLVPNENNFAPVSFKRIEAAS